MHQVRNETRARVVVVVVVWFDFTLLDRLSQMRKLPCGSRHEFLQEGWQNLLPAMRVEMNTPKRLVGTVAFCFRLLHGAIGVRAIVSDLVLRCNR